MTKYQKIISKAILAIAFIILLIYGWTSFATLFKLPIRQAKLYEYYHVPWIAFGIYNLLATAIAIGIVILSKKALKNENPSFLKKGIWLFTLLILFLVTGEIYLHNSLEEYLNNPLL